MFMLDLLARLVSPPQAAEKICHVFCITLLERLSGFGSVPVPDWAVLKSSTHPILIEHELAFCLLPNLEPRFPPLFFVLPIPNQIGEKSAELAAEDAAKSSTDSKAEAEVALRLRYADTLAQGFSATVYKDSDGFLTAGWGHRLTEEEAMKYEEGDVVDEETLNRWEDEEELDEDEVQTDASVH